MRTFQRLILVAAASATLLVTVDAEALTLGRVRGVALIGRPLNVTIPVTLDPGDADPCLNIEVLQGDTRVGAADVRLEKPASGPQVRVTTSVLVEEPVVTLFLRVGCTQQVTRRYVLLSEVIAETPAPPVTAAPARPPAASPAQVAPAAPGGQAVQAAPAGRAAAAPAAPAQAQARTSPATAPAERRPRAAATATPPATAAAAPSRGAERTQESTTRAPASRQERSLSTRERLRLEPLDLTSERSPNLRSSSALQSQPNDARRAQAAVLWQALNTTPESLAAQVKRMEAMDAQVRGLRDLVQQNTRALTQVGGQLEKARSERNMVAMVLIALAIAAIVGLVWFWRRGRSLADQPEWWKRVEEDSELPGDAVATAPAAAPPVVAPVRSPPVGAKESSVMPAIAAGATAAVAAAALAGRKGKSPAREAPDTGAVPTLEPVGPESSDFLHSQSTGMRMVKAEELIDIQQQVEFFVSIGQHDQAIAVLESHVHDEVETSPLPWLDLLGMYHQQGMRADFERIREEFHARFNGQVPAFEHYSRESAGLENYRRALSRIVALWPSRRVLQAIEESIFRKPSSPGGEPFDLEAYRDLLLLYNVAKDIMAQPGAEAEEVSKPGVEPHARQDFGATAMQQLPAQASDFGAFPELAAPPISVSRPGAGVDIDLDSLAAPDSEHADLGSDLLSFDLDPLPPETSSKPSRR